MCFSICVYLWVISFSQNFYHFSQTCPVFLTAFTSWVPQKSEIIQRASCLDLQNPWRSCSGRLRAVVQCHASSGTSSSFNMWSASWCQPVSTCVICVICVNTFTVDSVDLQWFTWVYHPPVSSNISNISNISNMENREHSTIGTIDDLPISIG